MKDNKEKLILSLYDYTGSWSKPYVDNKYPVMLWDAKIEGDILSDEFWSEVMHYADNIYGVLAAPPCTDFAGSGAMFWKEKDKDKERMDLSVALVVWVLHIIKMFPNLKFWALENPAGRIETLIPEIKPHRQMTFQPWMYGDAYTKRTVLWGNFNKNLIQNPVEPEYRTDSRGRRYSPIHFSTRGNDPKSSMLRSITPAGFANAFYNANQ